MAASDSYYLSLATIFLIKGLVPPDRGLKPALAIRWGSPGFLPGGDPRGAGRCARHYPEAGKKPAQGMPSGFLSCYPAFPLFSSPFHVPFLLVS